MIKGGTPRIREVLGLGLVLALGATIGISCSASDDSGMNGGGGNDGGTGGGGGDGGGGGSGDGGGGGANTCDTNADCTGGKTCQSGMCKAPMGGSTPANCTTTADCKANFECNDTAAGKRCQFIDPPGGGTPPAGGDKDDQDWIVDHLEIAATGTGFDFNGDGAPDNAAAGLLSNPLVKNQIGDPKELIQASLDDGTITLLIDSVGWADFAADADVGLELLIGMEKDDPAGLAECAPPAAGATDEEKAAAETACNTKLTEDNFSGSEELGVDCDSYDDNDKPKISYYNGKLEAGKLAAGPSLFEFVLPLADPPPVLTLHGTKLKADVAADGKTLGNGMIGGVIKVEELIDTILLIPQAAPYESVIRNLLPGLADMDLDGDGTKDGITIALLYSAVGVVIDKATPCGNAN